MGWKTINGRYYFYETVYVNDERTTRCWTLCHGALKASARAQQERFERANDLAWLNAIKARDQELDRRTDARETQVRQIIANHLGPKGYSYLRGQWRKRQASKMNSQPNLTAIKDEILTKNQTATSESCEQLSREIRRLALEALRGIPHPNQVTVETDGWDPADDQPQVKISCNVDDKIAAIEAKVKSMRDEFQYDLANTFDRLMIDQVTTAWVHWYVAGWLLDGELASNRSWRQNQYFDKRYHQCQSRLTRALDQLAKIRQIPSSKLQIKVPIATNPSPPRRDKTRRGKRGQNGNALQTARGN